MPETVDQILAPTDLSDASKAGLVEAAVLARCFGARLTAIYVVEDTLPAVVLGMDEKDRMEILEKHAERARERLQREVRDLAGDLEAEVVVLQGRPAPEILQYAEKISADLIVMSGHGHGSLGRFVLGGTTTKVLHRADCPVVVVPYERPA